MRQQFANPVDPDRRLVVRIHRVHELTTVCLDEAPELPLRLSDYQRIVRGIVRLVDPVHEVGDDSALDQPGWPVHHPVARRAVRRQLGRKDLAAGHDRRESKPPERVGVALRIERDGVLRRSL